MIELRGLTKRYGGKLAVDRLTFDIRPGRVTGFLGPNGAGKSTTMRLILGLDAPTAGSVTVGGRPYRSVRRPLHEVGSLLESAAIHPGRSARGHLLALARANGIGRRRVDEVLGIGLAAVGRVVSPAGQGEGGGRVTCPRSLVHAARMTGEPRRGQIPARALGAPASSSRVAGGQGLRGWPGGVTAERMLACRSPVTRCAHACCAAASCWST
jgi:ABC-2 type transport system ATP-binding protein